METIGEGKMVDEVAKKVMDELRKRGSITKDGCLRCNLCGRRWPFGDKPKHDPGCPK